MHDGSVEGTIDSDTATEELSERGTSSSSCKGDTATDAGEAERAGVEGTEGAALIAGDT